MKVLSEVANDALELAPGERRTLARILLELSSEGIHERERGIESGESLQRSRAIVAAATERPVAVLGQGAEEAEMTDLAIRAPRP
jgi:hypothetical protein